MRPRRRLALAAAFLVVATAGSRILGLIREVIMVSYLGLGDDMGAFTVANKVPNLVRTLLADTALSAAFIPVFSGLLEKERRREAWQVAFNVTMVATVVLGFICVLGMVFAPQVVRVVAPGPGFDDPEIAGAHRAPHAHHVPHRGDPGHRRASSWASSTPTTTSPCRRSRPIVWNLIIIAVVVAFAELRGQGSGLGRAGRARWWRC